MDHMIGFTLLHHELTRKSREKRKREWSLDAPLDAAPRRGILERLLAWRGVKRKAVDRGFKPSSAPHFR